MIKLSKKRYKRKRQLKKLKIHSFSNLELWNLDATLARYIAEGLRQYIKSERHGFPGKLLPKENPYNPTAEETQKAVQEWEKILKHMYYAFEQIYLNYPDSPRELWDKENNDYGRVKINYKTHSLDFSEIKEPPQEILDADHEYYQKIKEGLQLFAIYFQDLWD